VTHLTLRTDAFYISHAVVLEGTTDTDHFAES